MRWIFRLLGVVAALIVLAIGALFLMPADRIGQIASDQLEQRTGRTLTLSGEFRPSLWPILGVRTGRLTVSNADWAEAPVMIAADEAAVGVNLMALVGGDLKIETLRLVNPVVALERAADGRANWDLSTSDDASAAPTEKNAEGGVGGRAALTLTRGSIENGTVTYVDRTTGQELRVSALTGMMTLPDGAGPAEADFSAEINGTPAEVSLSVPDWQAALAGTATVLDARVAALGAEVTFEGTAGFGGGMPDVTGRAGVTVTRPADLAALAGVALPAQILGLRDAALAGELKLNATTLTWDGTLGGTLDGTKLTGATRISTTGDWMAARRFDTDIRLAAGDAVTVSYQGPVNGSGEGPILNGPLRLDAPDLRRALALGGVAFEAPAGTFGRATANADFRVRAKGDVVLRDGRYTLDQNILSGDVEVVLAAKPRITAGLSAGALDFSAFTGDGGSSGSGGSGSAEGWSKAPINVSGLDAVNADITLAAQSVNLGPTQLGRTDVALRLRDGQLRANLLEVRAFDGTLSGRITFSGGSGVSFDSDLRARGIQMETLLGQFAGITRFTGAGATDLRLTGRGNSVHALMNSLTGTGSIDLGQGTIRGIDLAALMRNLQQAFGGFEGATEFTSLTGTFSMNAGVLENIDLSLIAPLFRAGGKGTVDVGGQAMNYTVTPTRFADGAEFTVPVTITGAWSNLRIRPDVEALVALLANADLSGAEEIARAQEKLAEVKGLLENPEAAIEDRLKAELSRRLAEEVSIPGATPAPTPTDTTIGGGKEVAAAPETDLRDQVEDTLRDQLRRRLLGGESDVKPTPAPTPKPTAEAPASQGDGNGLAPVLSLRPRVRPAGLNTTVTAAPSAPDAPADTTAAAPADNRSTEERIKDELEDKAKDELRKLFKLGD